MKKGQTEIFGVVILVVFLTIIIFFVFFRSPESEPYQTGYFYQDTQADLLSLLDYQTSCGPLSHMMIDCFEKKYICSGVDSCHYSVYHTSQYLMIHHPDESLYITLSHDGNIIEEISFNNCDEHSEKKSVFAPLYSRNSTLVLSYARC